MALPYAPPLAHVLSEAEDIGEATGQQPSSALVLLAFFTSRNQAERLLRDRGIDEDRLLALVGEPSKEPAGSLQAILDRGAQVAAGCGANDVDTLHVLVAMTRARESLAYNLLEATKESLPGLRTRALTILTGAVPRWLNDRSYGRRGQSRKPGKRNVEVHSSLPRRSKAMPAGRSPALEWTPPLVKPKRSEKASEKAARLRKIHEQSQLEKQHIPVPEQAEEEAPPAKISETAKKPLARPDPVEPVDPAEHWVLPPAQYPWLSSIGRNLSAEAARGDLDRLVGRKKEVEELIDILGKRRANNPCLIGEPGVGKTAVVEGLAERLVRDSPSDRMADKIIVGLDVGALLVGTNLRGSFSEKLQGLKEEVKQSEGRVIVCFDELHTLVGAGSTGDGPQDAANELKSALARGDFPCIGTTTYDEYIKHVEPDGALKRRFTPVLIKEPDPPEAIEMVSLIMPAYAAHHEVTYKEEAIKAAVNLSARYITDRYLPDKAIALLDLAGSRAARGALEAVTEEMVARLVAERVEIPVQRLLSSDQDCMLNLQQLLEHQIVGHRQNLKQIAEVLRRNAAGFSSRRPQGVFLFVGPTGVGKTETAKALARILHGNEDTMIRFDLSEFSEAHAVARLVGAPPGYVGFSAGGQLTEAVRRRPARVVLFDEVEKAHRDVLQVMLQILDDGRLTDGHGRTVSFSETVVILTSNLGADLANLKRPIGFEAPEEEKKQVSDQIIERARARLSPELFGRIQERMVFAPLRQKEVRQIARLLAADSSRRLARDRGISFELDDTAVDYLLGQGGFDLSLGARPMRHILARIVEAPMAQRILEGRLHADEHVQVSTRENGGLVFLVGDDSLSQRPPH